MKNYIGFSRDHSGSMRSIARAAARDYNSKISSIQEAALSQNQDTIVSVVECGYGSTYRVRRDIVNSNVTALKPIAERDYITDGRGTPLWDSVGELIEMFESVPDANDKNVSFLVMAITDGAENASRKYSARSLAEKIRQLQMTDRWTFVFRVPRGQGRYIAQQLGVSEYNIQEWDQTDRGVEVAAKRDAEAFTQYFTSRSMGATSTAKFYANLDEKSFEQAKADMIDISGEVMLWPVADSEHDSMIRDFVEKKLRMVDKNAVMLKGAAFYQLTKTESAVQDYKKIVIRDKKTNALYGGDAARQALGLPKWGDCRLAPGSHPAFDIFVQSTSVNRKLPANTHCLYWPKVGVGYKEGPSAR